jgi:hypothetical protein
VLFGSVLIIALCGVASYLVGQSGAPDKAEGREVQAIAFDSSYSTAFTSSRESSLKKGLRKGFNSGRKEGRESGMKAGASAASTELARIEAERADAEAAAEAAALAAIPEVCRIGPDSTARRMCIGAVEAGTYP